MRLVACRNCHTQYDVTDVVDKEISCRCGSKVENRPLEGIEAQIHRCGACGAQIAADSASCEYCGSEIVRDEGKLSLICPECYGRNADESRYCTVCGVAFQPEKVEIEGEELPCPSCGCLMPVRGVAGVAVNECPECNGIWVPENRFDHLIVKACEAAQGARGIQARVSGMRVSGGNPARGRVVYRKCPVCEAHMQRANFRKRSGVIVDRCHSHGTWLDADELEQIAGFILEGGLGADGAREYITKTEINSIRRREIEAFRRATQGESITVQTRREQTSGSTFLGILKDLLS